MMHDTMGVLVPLLFQGAHDWGGPDTTGGFWGPWLIFPILFWGGIVFLIAWAVARIFPKGRADDRPEAPRDSAEEILRQRFARGEINAEEYERSLEVLRRGTSRKAHEEDSAREPGERES
jgi:putative membrane protein